MAGLLIFFIGFLGAGGCLPERCGVGVFLAQFTIIIIIIARAMAATTARAVPLLHFVTLHHALRRMAGLVFLLVFWALAGACRRHGVGFFLAQFTTSLHSSSGCRVRRGGRGMRGRFTPPAARPS